MPIYINSHETDQVLNSALNYCMLYRNEFVTPEHLLMAMTNLDNFSIALQASGGNTTRLMAQLDNVVGKMEKVPTEWFHVPENSVQTAEVLTNARKLAMMADVDMLQVPHLVTALLGLQNSDAAYLLSRQLGENASNFVAELVERHVQKT